jgi:hypothetical protein
MVYTLKDIKHLETIANLQNEKVEQPKPIFAQAEDTSLTATLLKLCNKLRAEGYNKYAESIENKFVNYKTAGVHLYQAHKETGEDLVDQAHPDGDNKIVSDVSDNNGDVETIVSKHKKIVDIVNKQPTGKLASYVEQCKIALGAPVDEIKVITNRVKKNINNLSNLISGGSGMWTDVGVIGIGTPLYQAKAYLGRIKEEISSSIPNIRSIEVAMEYLPLVNKKLEPTFYGTGVNKEIWGKVQEFLSAVQTDLESLKSLSSEYYIGQSEVEQDKNDKSVAKPTVSNTDNIIQSFQSMLALVAQLQNQVNNNKSPNKDKQLAWLNQMNEAIVDKITRYPFSENKELAAKEYTNILNQIKQRLDAFKSKLG